MRIRFGGKLWVVLRAAVSLLLLGFLFSRLDLRELAGLVRNAVPLYLALAFLCNLALMCLTAYRWHLLLSVQELPLSLLRTLHICFVSFFFHNFLPTSVGFDVVRGVYVARESGRKAEVVASIIADRLFGFLGLLLFILLALVFASGQLTRKELSLLIPASLGFLAVVSFLFLTRGPLDHFRGRLRRISLLRLGERIGRLLDSAYLYRERRRAVLGAITISLLIQSLLVLDNCFLGLSLNLKVSPFFYLVHIPIIALISMVPITISGFGVREGTYVLFFRRAGLATVESLSLSLLFVFVGIAGSLIGGFLFPFLRARVTRKEATGLSHSEIH